MSKVRVEGEKEPFPTRVLRIGEVLRKVIREVAGHEELLAVITVLEGITAELYDQRNPSTNKKRSGYR